MIELVLFFILIISLAFLIPGLFGAPYVPTLKEFVPVSLDMLDMKPGDTLLELGCGDGRIIVAAAKRGYNVVGYELNPLLAVIAWIRTIKYRKQVKIVFGNFFKKDLPPADGIFCFLMPKFMPAVNDKIEASNLKPIKLVTFSIPMTTRIPLVQSLHVFMYLYE